MTPTKKPLFLENEDWYYLDEDDDERTYKLNPNVPDEVRKSYEEFYKMLESKISHRKVERN